MVHQFLKSVNMKDVVELIAESWNEIEASTLRKSWQKIIPFQAQEQSGRDYVEEVEDEEGFIDSLHELGCNLKREDIHSWLNSDNNDPGFQIMTGD